MAFQFSIKACLDWLRAPLGLSKKRRNIFVLETAWRRRALVASWRLWPSGPQILQSPHPAPLALLRPLESGVQCVPLFAQQACPFARGKGWR